jgi:hypothetical protein
MKSRLCLVKGPKAIGSVPGEIKTKNFELWKGITIPAQGCRFYFNFLNAAQQFRNLVSFSSANKVDKAILDDSEDGFKSFVARRNRNWQCSDDHSFCPFWTP